MKYSLLKIILFFVLYQFNHSVSYSQVYSEDTLFIDDIDLVLNIDAGFMKSFHKSSFLSKYSYNDYKLKKNISFSAIPIYRFKIGFQGFNANLSAFFRNSFFKNGAKGSLETDSGIQLGQQMQSLFEYGFSTSYLFPTKIAVGAEISWFYLANNMCKYYLSSKGFINTYIYFNNYSLFLSKEYVLFNIPLYSKLGFTLKSAFLDKRWLESSFQPINNSTNYRSYFKNNPLTLSYEFGLNLDLPINPIFYYELLYLKEEYSIHMFGILLRLSIPN